jgi:hypothetical protein
VGWGGSSFMVNTVWAIWIFVDNETENRNLKTIHIEIAILLPYLIFNNKALA